jgi:hypothetical protein
MRDKTYFDLNELEKWLQLGDAPICLFVDDLVALESQLSSQEKKDALDCFIKKHFIHSLNRSFVKTSSDARECSQAKAIISPPRLKFLSQLHALSLNMSVTPWLVAFCGGYIGSVVDYLQTKKGIGDNVREAVVYNPAVDHFVPLYNVYARENNATALYHDALQSVITGKISDQLPTKTLPYLGYNDDGTFFWTMSGLQAFLDKAILSANDSKLTHIRSEMVDLCRKFKGAETASGKCFEAAFTLQLLLRLITHSPDGCLIPDHWMADSPTISYNEFCAVKNGLELYECRNLEQLEKYINTGGEFRHGHHIHVFVPEHSRFETYDVILVRIQDGEILGKRHYQLKDSDSHPKKNATDNNPSHDRFIHVMMRGCDNDFESLGWYVPGIESLLRFFGASGRHWMSIFFVPPRPPDKQQKQLSPKQPAQAKSQKAQKSQKAKKAKASSQEAEPVPQPVSSLLSLAAASCGKHWQAAADEVSQLYCDTIKTSQWFSHLQRLGRNFVARLPP